MRLCRVFVRLQLKTGTEWAYGGVDAAVLKRVTADFESGRSLRAWAEDPRGLARRRAALENFLRKIGGTNPRPKRAPKVVIRAPKFRPGECLSLRLADGQYAAASRSNQIFLYHVPSKRELGRLTDPSLLEKGIYKQPGVADLDLIQSLKFSPDGQWLASGGFRTVKLWQKPAGGKRLDLAALEGPPRSIAVSADSKFAAIGEETGKVKVFDLASGQIAKTLAEHGGPVTGVAFTADGAKLVTGSQDKTFRVFNLADQQQLASVETPAPINAVAIVGEGKLVATAGADNMLRTWDLPAMQPAEAPKPVKEIGGHGGPINSLVVVAANGAKVLTGCQDGGIRVVDSKRAAWRPMGGRRHGAAASAGPSVQQSARDRRARRGRIHPRRAARSRNASDMSPALREPARAGADL